MNIERIMASLEAKHPGESEYLQAVKEFFFPSKISITNILSSRKRKL